MNESENRGLECPAPLLSSNKNEQRIPRKDGERSCGFTGAFAVFSPNTTNFSKLAYVKLLYSAMLKVK